MAEYHVEFDGIDGYCSMDYETEFYGSLISKVQSVLIALNGGHADIFNEEGEFIDDVEI